VKKEREKEKLKKSEERSGKKREEKKRGRKKMNDAKKGIRREGERESRQALHRSKDAIYACLQVVALHLGRGHFAASLHLSLVSHLHASLGLV
jgi:hypothetical protein